MSLLTELKRRNVFRVGAAYLVLSWLLLQIGDVLFGMLDVPDWAGRLLIGLLAIGFIPAVVFAWVYELTPEGIKRESEIDRETSITPQTGRRLNWVIIVMMAFALGIYGFDRFTRQAEPDRSYESVAVLPFVDLSPEGDQEYFSDGIAEELLNVLARQPGLRVAARTSSFAFKGQNLPVTDIGEALDVAAILEGSVRRAGNQLRVSAQLVEVESGFQLWSDVYDRELRDIFTVQDEIAGAIVEAMTAALVGNSSPETAAGSNEVDLEAYQAFLEGRFLAEQRTSTSLPMSVKAFEQAIALAPDYAPAYAGLANTYTLMEQSPTSYGQLSRREVIQLGRPLVERAMALDPGLAEAHVVNGLLLELAFEQQAAVDAFTRAIELNPNLALAHRRLGVGLNRLGRVSEGSAAKRRALELDPMSPVTVQNWIVQLGFLGRAEEGREVAERIVRLRPNDSRALGALTTYYRFTAQFDLAHATLKKAEALDPENTSDRASLFYAYLDLGLFGLARDYADSSIQRSLLALAEGRCADAVSTFDGADLSKERLLQAWKAKVQQWCGSAAAAAENMDAAATWALAQPARLGIPRLDLGVEIVWNLRERGEQEEARSRLVFVEAVVRERREAGLGNVQQDYAEARLAVLTGDVPVALDLVEKLADRRAIDVPFMQDPVFRELQDEPRFRAAVERLEQYRTRQRQAILAQLGQE